MNKAEGYPRIHGKAFAHACHLRYESCAESSNVTRGGGGDRGARSREPRCNFPSRAIYGASLPRAQSVYPYIAKRVAFSSAAVISSSPPHAPSPPLPERSMIEPFVFILLPFQFYRLEEPLPRENSSSFHIDSPVPPRCRDMSVQKQGKCIPAVRSINRVPNGGLD